MILDAIINAGADGMMGMMNLLPQWQQQLDNQALNNVIQAIQAWDNWLPVTELATCITIAMGLWAALQAWAATLKAIETVKP